jgi:hypothetical protein
MANAKLSANIGRLWAFLASSLYGSDDALTMAAREALQNSTDAIRSLKRKGRFDIVYDEQARTLTFADDGCGMTRTTIFDKFLTLGESDKGGDAAGGFGVAKAVILGATGTFNWKLHTRDWLVQCSSIDADVQIEKSLKRQGAEITLFDIPDKYDWMHSSVTGEYGKITGRLHTLLSLNSLPDVDLYLNSARVHPKYVCSEVYLQSLDWGYGNSAVVYQVRRDIPSETRIIVQLNGLYQHSTTLYVKGQFDFVVNIATTNRPGEENYPFTASRDELRGPARYAMDALHTRIVKQMQEMAPKEEEVLDVDIFEDADLDALFADAGFMGLFAAALRKPSSRRFHTKRNEDEPMGAPSFGDNYGQTPAFIAHVPDQQGNFGSVRINLKTYDADKAAIFKENIAEYAHVAQIWTAVLRVVAARCRVTSKFKTGFVLDPNVAAQVIEQKGTNNVTIYLNPEHFEKIRTLGPEALAEFLANTAAHELAHIACPYGYASHGDKYIEIREAFGDDLWAVRPVVTHLVAHYFPSKET